MIKRLAIAGIVCFWLVMNVSLFRLWLNPLGSDVLSMPVEHVVRQMFVHQQPSLLTLFQNEARVGSLTLIPLREGDERPEVRFSGDAVPQLPLIGARSFRWHGAVTLDSQFAVATSALEVESRTPKATVKLDLDARTKRVTYSAKRGDAAPLTGAFTFDVAGLEQMLRQFGVGPEMVPHEVLTQIAANAQSDSQQIHLEARQAQTKVRGESVEIFRIRLLQEGSPLVEVDFSQLGQVLGVKTAFGIRLAPDDLLP